MTSNSIAIRFIALETETTRIEFMESWLHSVFDRSCVSRTPGVLVEDKSSVDLYSQLERLKRFGYGMTPSEIGCFLAHIDCWKECVDLNRCMLILESDVRPLDTGCFGSTIETLVNQFSDRFDMVRLHGVFERNEILKRNLAQISGQHKLVQTLGDVMGSAGYIITPFAAQRLLNRCASFYVPVDVFLGSTWLHGLRFRTIKPYLLEAHEFPSVIGERKRPKQSIFKRLSIEFARAKDDCRRILYLPWHFWG